MAFAVVACSICRKFTQLGTERWWGNRPLCPECQKIKAEDRAAKLREVKVLSTAELRGGSPQPAALPASEVPTPRRRRERKTVEKKFLPSVDPDEL